MHYLDVTSGDLYLICGKLSIVDWGEPLKTALVPGSEGQVFGWNDVGGRRVGSIANNVSTFLHPKENVVNRTSVK